MKRKLGFKVEPVRAAEDAPASGGRTNAASDRAALPVKTGLLAGGRTDAPER